jgi:hypothetical protein
VEISKPRIDLKKRKTLSTGTVVEIEDEINVVLLRRHSEHSTQT